MTDAADLRFGPFELQLQQRRLLQDGQPVTLGARAFDVLAALAQRRERVVGKDELLDLAWPGLVVEENNLQVQVSSLRKLLGQQAIATVPGRGYRFTAVLGDRALARAPAIAVVQAAVGRASVPAAVAGSQLFGREHDVLAVTRLMQTARVVSIVGAGGVGKTSLARAIVGGLKPSEAASPATWIELAPIATGSQALLRIADALGVDVGRESAARAALLDSLSRTTGWIVLDNCEHLFEALSGLVAEALERAPGVRWLTTSQQPLHVSGEHVYRLDSLAVPPPGTPLPQAREYSAVALLAARAAAAHRRFVLDAANVDAAVELCRQLDGIPLAIEMAAARLPAFGLRGVLQQLASRLMSLGGSGVAPSRQRTLRAALEWSHSQLTEPEQWAFRRLAPFTGGFSAALAEPLLAGLGTEQSPALGADAMDALATLVDKSLVQADDADPPRYRLLESAREFAFERLDAAGERALAQGWHARVVAARFAVAREDGDRLTELEWHATHVVERDNVRGALSWAAAHGDADTCARLLAFKGRIDGFSGVDDGVAGVAHALERAAQADPELLADALLWTAYGEFMRGDFAAANRYWPRALAHYKSIGWRSGLVWSLAVAVRCLRRTSGRTHELPAMLAELDAIDDAALPPTLRLNVVWTRLDAAEDSDALVRGLREFIQRCQRGSAYRLGAMAYANLSDQLLVVGDLNGAIDVARTQALQGGPRCPRPLAVAAANAAAAMVLLGRYEEAEAQFRSALRVLPNLTIMHFVLFYQAHAALQQGRIDDAVSIHGFVMAYSERLGVVTRGAEAAVSDATAQLLAQAVPSEELARRLAQAASLTQQEVLAIARLDSERSP